MKGNKRMIASIVEIAIGTVLLLCNLFGVLDEYWGGMGTALMVVGGIFLARQIKYRTNEEYRETVDTEAKDERNRYIAMKAWAWAGYLFVLIAAAASIVLKILGHDQLVHMTAGSACLIMILYWLSWLVLRKKY